MPHNKAIFCFKQLPPCYLAGVFFLYRTTENKILTRIPTGYGPRAAKHFIDGDESKYGLWEVNFLGYLRIQPLHQIILSPCDDMDFVEKNASITE